MTTIRHFTASAIVFDAELKHVLLVHHNRIGKWLYPGGHIDPNQAPAEAAIREVEEETSVRAAVVCGSPFSHPAVVAHALPYAIMEEAVVDAKLGEHRHIDFVYVLRALSSELAPQLAEVSSAQWTALSDVAQIDTPPELAALIADTAEWAKPRWHRTEWQAAHPASP